MKLKNSHIDLIHNLPLSIDIKKILMANLIHRSPKVIILANAQHAQILMCIA